MTVNELVNVCDFTTISLPDGDREISGVYIGDLLSWVMGRAKSGNVWITIMSNVNVLAVASLADTSCVILAEGVELAEDIKALALEKQVNILSSQKSAYQIAIDVSRAI